MAAVRHGVNASVGSANPAPGRQLCPRFKAVLRSSSERLLPSFTRMSSSIKSPKDTVQARRTAYSHWAREQVRFSDTDMLGHVNNASLATYYETGRTECILKALTTEVASGIVYVVAKLAINFMGEVHWPARIDIGTGILSIGRSSFVVGQALFDGDTCMGIAESVMVAIDTHSRVPCAIPEWEREQLSCIRIAAA